MKTVTRYAIAMPFAAGLTVGMGLFMVALIAIDKVSVDESAALKIAAINPVEIDIAPPVRIKEPKLKSVQIPPAPPSYDRTKANIPASQPINSAELPPFILPKPSLAKFEAIKVQDIQPINRFAPAMPGRAERSGHCKMSFDVSAEGSPFNVIATHCSQSLFERASIKSVQKWRYLPQYKDGLAVPYIGLTETIRFNLTDEGGNIIPE